MEGARVIPHLIATIGVVLGLLPFILLFVDYRKRGQIHKPLIYLAVFGVSIAFVLPILLKIFGLWLALITPFAVMGYVLLMSRSHDSKGRNASGTE